MDQLQYDIFVDSATAIYDKMCEAIYHAIETVVSTVNRTRGIKLKISDPDKALYKKSTEMTVTKSQYKEVQKEIKESSLQGFHDWVAEWADKMQSANAVGDTHKVFDGVKALRGKRERPPCNLSTDAQGAPLDDAAAVAQVWEEFLSDKFAATEAEAKRPDMEELPATQGTDQLELGEILQGMQKMCNGKACGPDDIPVIIYKKSVVCRDLLVNLLQTIWDTEEVPVKFVRATFVMLYKNKGSFFDPFCL